jgi:hypothetical protein
MTGPKPKKMPDKLVCTGCDAVVERKIGGTTLYPEVRTNRYCTHEDLTMSVAYIKSWPYTPKKWCPVLVRMDGHKRLA